MAKKKSEPAVAEAPPKMKPSLHVDMEEIEGLGSAEIDDLITLEVKAKIIGLHKNQYDKETDTTSMDMEIQSIKSLGETSTDEAVDESEPSSMDGDLSGMLG